MKFVKKLIVLTGKTSKGTLTLEQVSDGIAYKLATFNLASASSRELALFFDGEIHIVKVTEGRAEGVLPVSPPQSVHSAVMLGGRVEMYGATKDRMAFFQIEQAYAVKKFGGKNSVVGGINTIDDTNTDEHKNVTTTAEDSAEIADEAQESLKREGKAAENEKLRESARIQDYFLEILPSNHTKETEQATDENKFLRQDACDLKEHSSEGQASETEVVCYQDDAIAKENYFEIEKERLDSAETAEVIEPQFNVTQLQPIYNGADDVADGKIEKYLDEQNGKNDSGEQKITEGFDCGAITVQPRSRKASGIYDKEIFGRDQVSARRSLRPTQNSAGERETTLTEQCEEVAAAQAYQPRKASFYEKNKTDLEQLFRKYARYEPLEKLVPGSRWVKIDYDSGRYYLVGITADYLCYGVPAKYSPTPPKEFEGYCSWMPKISTEPAGEGFWIIYQDLASGKTLRGQR
ncbi:MAG: hypothetical protein IJD07_02635 [Clostridia bacterium]|nr:hypothetical protein [Clostridia bacterium]